MRFLVWAIILFVPAVSSGYNPPASDLLRKMEAAWQRLKPVQVQVALETPEGRLLEERTVSVPLRMDPETFRRSDVLKAGYLPFVYLTSDSQILNQLLPSLHQDNVTVRLARIQNVVCFVIEGTDSILWLRKADLYPLKSEMRLNNGHRVICHYLDLVQISDKIAYPGRTEVLSEEQPILIERLKEQQPGSFSP